MNREQVKRQRYIAERDAEHFLPLSNEMGPYSSWTPLEAYAGARWFAAMHMLALCDALLAEDAPQPSAHAQLVSMTQARDGAAQDPRAPVPGRPGRADGGRGLIVASDGNINVRHCCEACGTAFWRKANDPSLHLHEGLGNRESRRGFRYAPG